MGLNLTFAEQTAWDRETDEELPGFYHKPNTVANCTGKVYGEYSCDRCPLSCGRGSFSGCAPRMGSYTYVASLPEYMKLPRHRSFPRNEFLDSIRGGGFHPRKEAHGGFLELLLRDVEDLRIYLDDHLTEGAVLRANGGKQLSIQYARSEINSIGGKSWFYRGKHTVGVHYDMGIWVHPENVYYRRISDPEIVSCFVGFGSKDPGEGAYVEMSHTLPALPRFQHLLDTFETVATLALENDLTVIGC